MSMKDKVTGRLKQAAGDLTGDEKLRRQGIDEERKGDAKQELREAEREAAAKRSEVARLEADGASPGARHGSGDEHGSERHEQYGNRGFDQSGDDALNRPRSDR